MFIYRVVRLQITLESTGLGTIIWASKEIPRAWLIRNLRPYFDQSWKGQLDDATYQMFKL